MAKRKQSDSVRKMRLIILGLSIALIAAVVALTWFTLSRESENGQINWQVASTTATTKQYAGEPEQTTSAGGNSADITTTTGADGLPYDAYSSDLYAEWNGKYPTAEVVLKKDKDGWWYAYVSDKKVKDCTGVYVNENGWWFVRDGRVDPHYNGIAGNSKGKWYIKNGFVDFTFSGAYTARDSGNHYTVVEGKVAEIAN